MIEKYKRNTFNQYIFDILVYFFNNKLKCAKFIHTCGNASFTNRFYRIILKFISSLIKSVKFSFK